MKHQVHSFSVIILVNTLMGLCFFTGCSETNESRVDASPGNGVFDASLSDAAGEAEEILKAFPTAVGGASNITGGRGGTVIHVTNLNDDGPGSLRDALTSTGARIIVFDVSGRIHLNSRLSLRETHSDFTLAGQTAPLGGITISGFPIDFTGCNNMIYRYVRIRNGSYNGISDEIDHNGFWSNGVIGVMWDHVSFSFNNDQAISLNNRLTDVRDITIQRSLFGENGTNIIFGSNNSFPGTDGTVMYNLFSNPPHRQPNTGSDGRFDVLNNVTWNFPSRVVNMNLLGAEMNYMGNYLRPGNHSTGSAPNKSQSDGSTIHTANNYHPDLAATPTVDDQSLWGSFFADEPLAASMFRADSFPFLPNTPDLVSAQSAYDTVLADVGANKYLDDDGYVQTYLDSYDTERIDDVLSLTSRDPFNKVWVQPTLPMNTRPDSFDTDQYGMADAWEVRMFGNLAMEASGDNDEDGYSNIEEYFNQVDY